MSGFHLQGRFFKRRVRAFTVSKDEYKALSQEGNSLPQGSSALDALTFVATNAKDMPVPVVDLLTQTPARARPSPVFSLQKDQYGNWRVSTKL